MKAILVGHPKPDRPSTWHWLNEHDEGRTLCGRSRLELAVEGEEERDFLPAVQACGGCVRNANGWHKPKTTTAQPKATLEPSLGTLRRSGSLTHGARSRHGQRLR